MSLSVFLLRAPEGACMKELVPARALNEFERLFRRVFVACLLICMAVRKTSRSLDIYMSHFSALLLSDHQADGRLMWHFHGALILSVFFSFLVDFKQAV